MFSTVEITVSSEHGDVTLTVNEGETLMVRAQSPLAGTPRAAHLPACANVGGRLTWAAVGRLQDIALDNDLDLECARLLPPPLNPPALPSSPCLALFAPASTLPPH
eukprot:COSAG04_NODE_559_length_12608_cov_12.306499_14_plen_106_part_00